MKKKIIFMIINMNVGGTEKALLNMISEIPKDQYDITILMLEKYGGFLNSIPDYVHIECLKGYSEIKKILTLPPRQVVWQYLKERKIFKAFNLFFFYLISKTMKERSLFFKYLLSGVPAVKDEYDLAVAYAGPMDFISFFVVKKIKAKKKVQWIHFDVTKIGFNKNFTSKIYKKFNKIFVVSNEARNKLIHLLPKLSGKVDVITNIVSIPLIKNQSIKSGGFTDNFNGFRILTVGRLSHEKGQDLAIRAFSKIIKEGYNVRWYCLGEGRTRGELEKLIKEYDITDKFILLGVNPNPYTFMRQCDIYVQTSRYEGYCLSLIEAKCFNKPIITTNVNGANEIIINGDTGLIVDIDENQIYIALKRLLDDEILRCAIEQNLQQDQKKETNNIEKLYEVVN